MADRLNEVEADVIELLRLAQETSEQLSHSVDCDILRVQSLSKQYFDRLKRIRSQLVKEVDEINQKSVCKTTEEVNINAEKLRKSIEEAVAQLESDD